MEYIHNLMKELTFPEEAIKFFDAEFKSYDYISEFVPLREEFMASPSKFEEGKVHAIANKQAKSILTVNMMFLLYCCEALEKKYRENGLPREMFIDLMKDLKYKAVECHDVEKVWGTFVFSWFPIHYEMTIFALGRFQYQKYIFEQDSYNKFGINLKRGDSVYTIHIPSAGKIDEETRLDSYKKAYKFISEKEHINGNIAFVCHSWLLYPSHKDVFRKDSNIYNFANDFEILGKTDTEDFGDAWRVFKMHFDGDILKLPADTTLQKDFITHLKNGGKFGYGYGIMVFDGEKIINNH